MSSARGLPSSQGRRLPPTQDPQEALEFCRALASAMELTATTEDHRQPPALIAAILGQRVGSAPPPMLSIVIPVFNEEENLQTLHTRLTRTLTEQGLDYEIVFIDDGSHDHSPEILRRLESEDHRVVVVEFARNFGHQVAISAGLEHSRGRVVSIMDVDLQDPPEVLHTSLAKWQEGWEVVYAVRTERKEWWGKRLAYAGFYRLLQRVANIEIPLDAGDFCVMDRKVVDLLVRMPERPGIDPGRHTIELNETQILKSRPIMAEVVRKLVLDVEYYVKGRVRISEVYPVGALKAALYEVSENGYNVPFEITVLDVRRFRLRRGQTQ